MLIILLLTAFLASACATAPIRPMPPEHDPASVHAAEVDYVMPVNPLTHDVPDDGDDQASGDEHAHHRHANDEAERRETSTKGAP